MSTHPIRDSIGLIFYQRCFYLFVALLALLLAFLVVAPMSHELPYGKLIVGAAQAFVLVAAVAAVSRSMPAFVLTVLLAAAAIGLTFFGVSPGAVRAGLIAATGAYLVTFVMLLTYVLRPQVMNADKLFGAGAAYMLMGVTYGAGYAIVQDFFPGSFAFGGAVTALARYDLVYFSFTVLSSTGFGDITANLPPARALVVMEQISGVLYVAIIIARLAGIYPAAEKQD
jgi:hypothetical protein